MQAANAFRDDYEEYVCPVDDDKRRKTVALVSDPPEHVLDRAHVEAASGRSERASGAGQIELTDAEKDRLGPFTGDNSYRKAAAAKAIFREEGVDDWTSYYDETLTVDEHRDLAERAARDGGGGRRLDAEDSADDRLGRAEKAMGEECDHARDHCQHGDPDACEFLSEACGYDDEEVASILDDADASTEQEIEGEAAGALGRAWQGYKAAIARLAAELDDALEAKQNAEQAAAAINAIRADHGQEPIELERLEELSDRLAAEGDTAHDAEGHTERQNTT
ncbi:hypothetical protein [Halobacterium rubrum]|uniref:hypothetical protein n=1 Tax=Halobacterium TaxID=2239 RepID=UPI001F34E280|nr:MULTISPECIES: hypothetical protein [Halobacterium]MDH5019043.1 hypothetical protein [Halobacterium rubrum]